MKKTLPSIRVKEVQISNMESALAKLNKLNLTPITFQEYRRFCYEVFTRIVLQEDPEQIKNLLQRQ